MVNDDLVKLEERVRELEALQQNYVILNKVYHPPERFVEGMLVYADGTSWDPGCGEGLYHRRGGAWIHLMTGCNKEFQYETYISKLYPAYNLDEMAMTAALSNAGTVIPPVELMSIGATLVSGTLDTILVLYSDWPEESMEFEASLVSGTLAVVVSYGTYTDGLPEEMALSCSLSSGALNIVVDYIAYTHWPLDVDEESMNISAQLIGGTLSVP